MSLLPRVAGTAGGMASFLRVASIYALPVLFVVLPLMHTAVCTAVVCNGR
jgi:hypothetical protein